MQSWLDDRCEARIVVSWDLGELALLFRLGVQIGVDAADEPEHGWNAPLGSKRSEVFARRRWLRFLHTLSRKVADEGVMDSPRRCRIVHHERIPVQWRDLRLFRRA